MAKAEPKKPGRPRKPVQEPSPSQTIKVYRKIPGGEEVRLTATHENVSGDWSHEMILKRFGIGRHLKVVATTKGRSLILQDFPTQ